MHKPVPMLLFRRLILLLVISAIPLMGTLFLSVLVPTRKGEIVPGGPGNNGICLAIIYLITGGMPLIGLSMLCVLDYPSGLLQDRDHSPSFPVEMVYGRLGQQAMWHL